MNKLQHLRSEIQLLPEKRKLANDVGVLEKYNTQMVNALETLTQTRNFSAYIQIVSKDTDLKLVNDKIDQVAKTAQRLRKSLSDKIENIKNADDKVIIIEKTTQGASTVLRDKWRTFLQGKIEIYEKLVAAAAGANLSGSDMLIQTLHRLRGKLDSPPETEEKATKISEELESVANSFETLGLEGKVGEFLTAASTGHATAKMLLDNEVQEFIEQNNLWTALSVKLN